MTIEQIIADSKALFGDQHDPVPGTLLVSIPMVLVGIAAVFIA